MKILCNKIQCSKCKQIIESILETDVKYCKCNTVSVSGGLIHLSRSGKNNEYIELSEFQDGDKIIKTGEAL